jgi:hypothetical protein
VKTIVALGHRTFQDRQFVHGAEIDPDLLSVEQIDLEVDHKGVVEYDAAERRSLYRIFSVFSGCSESENLSNDELAQFSLPA